MATVVAKSGVAAECVVAADSDSSVDAGYVLSLP